MKAFEFTLTGSGGEGSLEFRGQCRGQGMFGFFLVRVSGLGCKVVRAKGCQRALGFKILDLGFKRLGEDLNYEPSVYAL